MGTQNIILQKKQKNSSRTLTVFLDIEGDDSQLNKIAGINALSKMSKAILNAPNLSALLSSMILLISYTESLAITTLFITV